MRGQFENYFNPEEIEQLARSTQFVQRQGMLDGLTFLRVIVFNRNSLATESLNDLTITLEKEYHVEITKQSLHERFSVHAVGFLKAALDTLFYKQLYAKVNFNNCKEFKRFLIKDSVCFQVDESLADQYPGSGGSGSKANVRIQFEYDLLHGKIVDLSINAFNDQDANNSTVTIDVIEQGDLVVRDLAYMHLDVLHKIVNKYADFLCRLNTQAKVYQLQGDEFVELDFALIVAAMRKHNVSKIEEVVWLGKDHDFKVRLFIFLMPEAEYNERIRKAQQNAQKKGRQLSKKFKARAGLNLFITSAPPELITIDTAWKIYSLRWQIELAFKVWKSIWKIDKVKKVKKDRLDCYILSKLLIIMLTWRIVWFTGRLLVQFYGKNISHYKAFKTLMKDVARLEMIFIEKSLSVVDYLIEFLQISSKKHVLEQRREHRYSPDLLYSSLTIVSDLNC
ncbi:MAG: IS4 family transposase [Thermodesulfobacteriota bacterium]|nr:IS4 family transposase [Thermodesulfobacteriota bacterium]